MRPVIRLMKPGEVVVPMTVLTELLAAGQDLRTSAIAGNANMVTPARQRWLAAEISLMKALAS